MLITVSLLGGIVVGVAVTLLVLRLRGQRFSTFIRTESAPAWVAAIAGFAGTLVALLALAFSNYYAAQSSADSHKSSQAAIKELELERSPVLTQVCDTQRKTGWTIARSYAPNSVEWLTGEMGVFVPKLTNNSIMCTIHNYSRLPVVDLHFEFGYSPCASAPTKTASISVPVIAPGGETRILVANASQYSSMTMEPLRTTHFAVPPERATVSYSYPGFTVVQYQLGISESSSAVLTKEAYGFCKDIERRQIQRGLNYWRKIELSFHVNDAVTSNFPSIFPIGNLSSTGRCPATQSMIIGTSAHPIYALGRVFYIKKLSPDSTVATLRGPTGGTVCAQTAILSHARR